MERVTIVKLALLLGGVFGPCAALQTTKGWRAEKALPFSMCAHSLLLFAFGMFLPFSWCVSGLLVLDALAWLYAVKRSGSVFGLLRVFKDPVWWLTALIVPVLYYACCNRRLMSYDEYSHWGLMIKNIVAFDALPRRGAGAAFVLYDYPPMGALFPAMVCRIFGYRDGMAYFGYELLLLTLAAGLSWACGNIFNKLIMQHEARPAVMSLVVWSALIPVIPFLLASSILDGPAVMLQSLVDIDLTTILSLVYLAFVATIVGYGIWGSLLGRYETWRVAPLSLLVPVVGLASAAILLDETLSALQLFGAVLIMAGLYINVFGLRVRRTTRVSEKA